MVQFKLPDQNLLLGVGVAAATTYYVIAASTIYMMMGKFSSPNPKLRKINLLDLPTMSQMTSSTSEVPTTVSASSSTTESDSNAAHPPPVRKLVSGMMGGSLAI